MERVAVDAVRAGMLFRMASIVLKKQAPANHGLDHVMNANFHLSWRLLGIILACTTHGARENVNTIPYLDTNLPYVPYLT